MVLTFFLFDHEYLKKIISVFCGNADWGSGAVFM
jgi:hypothetical protein